MQREEYKFVEEVCEKYGREKAIIKIDFNSKQIKTGKYRPFFKKIFKRGN